MAESTEQQSAAEQADAETEGAGIAIEAYSDQHEEGINRLINEVYENELGHHSESGRPDLHKIPEIYQDPGGNFWVALDGGQVVGTIALINEGQSRASLHRFCVGKEFRGEGKGVSKKLLSTLLDFAHSQGYKKIFLSTWTEDSRAAGFYDKNRIPRVESLPKDIAERSYFEDESIFYEIDLEKETE